VIRSALGRKVDPTYPTNLAVLIVAPLAGLIAAGYSLSQDLPVRDVLELLVRGSLAAFLGWALARELEPDRNAVAFLSLAVALIALLVIPGASIVLVLLAMMLCRMVARPVGPPATVIDSIFVFGLTCWATYSTRSPAVGAVGAIGFALDATMAPPQRRQWIFAVLCLVASAIFVTHHATLLSGSLSLARAIALGIISVGFLVTTWAMRAVHSLSDATGQPLVLRRVKAGMLVVWVTAGQGIVFGQTGLEQTILIWTTIACVALMRVLSPVLPGRNLEAETPVRQ
jgi:hypothetical protein